MLVVGGRSLPTSAAAGGSASNLSVWDTMAPTASSCVGRLVNHQVCVLCTWVLGGGGGGWVGLCVFRGWVAWAVLGQAEQRPLLRAGGIVRRARLGFNSPLTALSRAVSMHPTALLLSPLHPAPCTTFVFPLHDRPR